MKTIDPDALPRHYEAAEAEAKWEKAWDESRIYRYDPSRPREETFSVDTPPPTVSGSLHLGHVFSYTHTDIIVRYKRMRGMNVFYPMGWDDNGLPTERRVQNFFHIRCDADAAHDPSWEPKVPGNDERRGPARKVSRENFIRACGELTRIDEKTFERLWTRTGLSVDWERGYETIGAIARKAAQLSFIELYRDGHVYSSDLPTMWDVDFETAVAQAEIEDKVERSAYHRLPFLIDGSGEHVVVATTRPELLPACVGITAHPDDPRYRHLFGRKAVTPFFGTPVPIFPSPEADPEKGTGILMVCTFGDAADVAWWRREELPLRQLIGRDGRMVRAEFGTSDFPSVDPERANEIMGALEGLSVSQARKTMAGMIYEAGAFDGFAPEFDPGEPEIVEHAVRYYEKGSRPVEYIGTRQWFVRLLDKKERLIDMGRRITWHPDHMRLRYENWTENLVYDWCISRQRSYGVPFPLWYRTDEGGEPDYADPILAREEDLPVDPSIDVPPGFEPEDRGKPGGFIAESDVFDTWFTSSLTPQIAGRRMEDPEGFRNLFPMDLRPQSHEIIRTWAFYTIAKAMLHEGTIPWENVAISGWILDPDRKKMSKSKGNAVTPLDYFDRYSADAVRYWAAGARLGTDTAIDEKMLASGRRLTVKLYNAAKFVLSKLHAWDSETAAETAVTEILDRSFLSALGRCAADSGAAMERYEFARALGTVEEFFWHSFTDSYIELAKTRASAEGGGGRSARSALRIALTTLLRLFAPFIPFVTEEIWSWLGRRPLPEGSIHVAKWPDASDIAPLSEGAETGIFVSATAALSAIHKAKSLNGKSIGSPVRSITLRCGEGEREAILACASDIMSAGRVDRWDLVTDPDEVRGGVEAADPVFGDR